VQAHAGAIVVDSAPGKGTCFTVFLPAAEAQAGAPAPGESANAAVAAPATRPGDAQHILYIDDDESLVFLVRRLLARRGYQVSGHVDPAAALAELRADPQGFDLVVTDYNMPGMSGLEVARAVRAIRAELPVAVASGYIDDKLRADASAAGVSELIFKADAVEDLCDAFARLAQTAAK
jgi:CheY-like chemotaxis protein